MERRLAAILAADVVGYSRLIRADEEGTIAALQALRADLIDPKIAEHHGRIVKLMGDGMLAEFASVVDAVRAAAEVQQAVAERQADLPQERRRSAMSKTATAPEPEVAATAGICCEVAAKAITAFEHEVAVMPTAGCGHPKTSMAATGPDFELPPETVKDTESRVIHKATMDLDSGVIHKATIDLDSGVIPEVLNGFLSEGGRGARKKQDGSENGPAFHVASP